MNLPTSSCILTSKSLPQEECVPINVLRSMVEGGGSSTMLDLPEVIQPVMESESTGKGYRVVGWLRGNVYVVVVRAG